jgi:hypothetical protein
MIRHGVVKKMIAAGAVVAGVFALNVGTAAAAGSDHGITGTNYASGDLYISSNARFKEGTGAVTVMFSSLPKNGQYFELLSVSYALIGNPQTWTKSETNVRRTLASSVTNGRQFYNAFRLSSGCPQGGCSPYNFIGSEHY